MFSLRDFLERHYITVPLQKLLKATEFTPRYPGVVHPGSSYSDERPFPLAIPKVDRLRRPTKSMLKYFTK